MSSAPMLKLQAMTSDGSTTLDTSPFGRTIAAPGRSAAAASTVYFPDANARLARVIFDLMYKAFVTDDGNDSAQGWSDGRADGHGSTRGRGGGGYAGRQNLLRAANWKGQEVGLRVLSFIHHPWNLYRPD